MVCYILRYAEIALKGSNREWFENALIRNVRSHLKELEGVKINRLHGRILLFSDSSAEEVEARLKNIPGLANFSLANSCSHELEEIFQTCIQVLESYLQKHEEAKPEPLRFRVETQRSDKSFPMNSMELSAKVGAAVLEKRPELKVDLTKPDLTLGIEVWTKNRAVVFLEKIQGPGGLPVGTSGRIISFLSGGIDSPVASWFMMKRGCEAVFLNFHSYPFIGEQSKEKVISLVRHLSRYQPKSHLIIAPFAEIQKAIKENCKERYRTLLYRRMMNRIAEGFRQRLKIKAYVTGEALGQVASQTIENIGCTEATAQVPVLRPLIGMEKQDIVELAKKIGTYPISIQPFQDCCTVFQPKKPETHARLEDLILEEEGWDWQALVEISIENSEHLYYDSELSESFWQS